MERVRLILGHPAISRKFLAKRHSIKHHTILNPEAHPSELLVWLQETQGFANAVNVHIREAG